jgi:hypothetical protein
MPTYDRLATTTLGSNTATITFSSIDQTYTDLILIMSCSINTSGGNCWVRVNGDTSSNYAYNGMFNNGSTVSGAVGSSTANGLLVGGISNWDTNESIFILQINSYANTTTYKTGSSRGNNPSSSVDRTGSLWKSTAAINSLLIRNGDGNLFLTGSKFTIYGIKAA